MDNEQWGNVCKILNINIVLRFNSPLSVVHYHEPLNKKL